MLHIREVSYRTQWAALKHAYSKYFWNKRTTVVWLIDYSLGDFFLFFLSQGYKQKNITESWSFQVHQRNIRFEEHSWYALLRPSLLWQWKDQSSVLPPLYRWEWCPKEFLLPAGPHRKAILCTTYTYRGHKKVKERGHLIPAEADKNDGIFF